MDIKININIPQDVKEIAMKLENAGYETYIVGGCVRDAILGRKNKDWDITTSAPVDVIKSIFSGKDAATLNIAGSLEHGVCFVLYNGEQYEIATFRKDGDYFDGRHCEVITGVPLYEDLKRRDFTINAMAIRILTGEFVDLFGGYEDCKNKKIVAVGRAKDRFREDSLRIARAFRFAAQLGFVIDEEIIDAISDLKKNIPQVSEERRENEFTKIICSDDCERILSLMYDMGVMEYLLPEFETIMNCEQNNPNHCYNVGLHTLKCMSNIPPIAELRYAALLHDFGKPTTKTTDEFGIDHFKGHAIVSCEIANVILRRMKFENSFIAKVTTLIEYHDSDFLTKKSIRRFLGKYDENLLDMVLTLRLADTLAQNPNYNLEEKKNKIAMARELLKEVLANETAFSLKDMAISGKDLIAIGIKPGVKMGEILKTLYEEVLENPDLNTYDILIEKAKLM